MARTNNFVLADGRTVTCTAQPGRLERTTAASKKKYQKAKAEGRGSSTLQTEVVFIIKLPGDTEVRVFTRPDLALVPRAAQLLGDYYFEEGYNPQPPRPGDLIVDADLDAVEVRVAPGSVLPSLARTGVFLVRTTQGVLVWVQRCIGGVSFWRPAATVWGD